MGALQRRDRRARSFVPSSPQLTTQSCTLPAVNPTPSRLARLRPAVWLAGFALVVSAGCDREGCYTAIGLSSTSGIAIPATLAPQSYVTAERVDVLIDWAGLDQDMRCTSMDPVADIDKVGITRFPLISAAEVDVGLVQGTLRQSDTNGFIACEPGNETSCWLSDFAFGGSAYDVISIYSPESGVFLASFSTGLGPWDDVRAFAWLSPSPESDVALVSIVPTCGDLASETPDLAGATPMVFSPDGDTGSPESGDTGECVEHAAPYWPIEWGDLTVNAAGGAYSPADVEEVVVARYDQTFGELEAAFANRDSLAAERYVLRVDGQTSANLGDATSATLAPFAGFTGSGIWLLELRDDAGVLGIPVFLAVVAGD